MGSLNIAIVSDTQPKNTGSGGRVAAYGLKNLLTQLGHKVTFFMPAEFIKTDPLPEGVQVFDDIKMRNSKIDLVWLFNIRTWKYVRPYTHSYRFVLYCFEPLHRIGYLRSQFKRKYHQGRVNYFRHFLESLKIELLRLQEIASLREISQQAVVTAFAPNAQRIWQKYTSKEMMACPLPYPDFGLRKNRYGIGNGTGLLLGNMNSIHTRYGLDFFFEQIWMKTNLPLNATMPVLHIVGGGEMPTTFMKPQESQNLIWKGFVPDLELEWEQAKYLLVPVPISDGVRSRIIEAWCRGVPVIAHPAAEEGLTMMKNGINYISAESPDEWLAELTKVRGVDELETLILGGRNAYEQYFSEAALSPVYQNIIKMALH